MTSLKDPEREFGSAPLVLVIEDEEAVLRLLGIKLPRANFRVQARRYLDTDVPARLLEKPDLIILGDQSGKGVDQCVLARQLAEKWGTESPPIVMLSGSTDPGAIAKGLECGCDDYITKPFSPSELIQRLRVVLIKDGLRRARDRGVVSALNG
jgi:DNA-binding response OmpR family regulator